jgi:hypothetical protein
MFLIPPDVPPLRDPQAVLERAIIEEFLATRGESLAMLRERDDPSAHALLRAASIYRRSATGRIARDLPARPPRAAVARPAEPTPIATLAAPRRPSRERRSVPPRRHARPQTTRPVIRSDLLAWPA